MGRRWKWFLRPGETAVDLVGQVEPDADDPGRYRRGAGEGFVPEVRARSRCDGAIVYERPEEPRPAAEANSRSGRYQRKPSAGRNQRTYRPPGDALRPYPDGVSGTGGDA